jgi:hypothetical protein
MSDEKESGKRIRIIIVTKVVGSGIHKRLTTKCAPVVCSRLEVRTEAIFWIRARKITFVYCQCPF